MLWDPIRSKWVRATPEEHVRQALIQKMIGPLGFPKGWIAVEKDLASLPHVAPLTLPNRRLDLLCYKQGMTPLLLAECKAVDLNEDAERQLLGYNAFVKAPFLCLVNTTQTHTFWLESGHVTSVPFLPSYAQLVAQC